MLKKSVSCDCLLRQFTPLLVKYISQRRIIKYLYIIYILSSVEEGGLLVGGEVRLPEQGESEPARELGSLHAKNNVIKLHQHKQKVNFFIIV